MINIPQREALAQLDQSNVSLASLAKAKTQKNHCRICGINGQVEHDPVNPGPANGKPILVRWWYPRKNETDEKEELEGLVDYFCGRLQRAQYCDMTSFCFRVRSV